MPMTFIKILTCPHRLRRETATEVGVLPKTEGTRAEVGRLSCLSNAGRDFAVEKKKDWNQFPFLASQLKIRFNFAKKRVAQSAIARFIEHRCASDWALTDLAVRG